VATVEGDHVYKGKKRWGDDPIATIDGDHVYAGKKRWGEDPIATLEEGGAANVATAGFIGRMRVDKNPALVGDCLTIPDGTCLFNDKKENARFLTELETGKSLALEVGTKVFDFDLADYPKALAAYMKVVTPDRPATSPATPQAAPTPPPPSS
jgi:hypothetical protein